jgi:hypothetical protein
MKKEISAYGDPQAIADIISGKTPMAFQEGEIMICVVCGRFELAKAGKNSEWRAIDTSRHRRLYACPKEFPPDEAKASAQEYEKAYRRVLKFATDVSRSRN